MENIIIIILSFFAIYLIFCYKRLLDKFSDLSTKRIKGEIEEKMKNSVDHFVDSKVDLAIARATEDAVLLISKNAENVAKSMRKKTIEKLIEEEKGEERAVSSEYEEAKSEIERYKTTEFERIRKNANEILQQKMPEIVAGSVTTEKQNELIMKALEDAKRSNIF